MAVKRVLVALNSFATFVDHLTHMLVLVALMTTLMVL